MAATTDIYGNQNVSTGSSSVQQKPGLFGNLLNTAVSGMKDSAAKINPVTGLPVTAADRSSLKPMAQATQPVAQKSVFNVDNAAPTASTDNTITNFQNLQDGIWDRTNRQADILRTQAKTAATDQAGQAGLLAGSQGARRLQNSMLDQQATGIGNLMDTASSASANLGQAEIARNDSQIADLLAMAEGNQALQAHILQGQGRGDSFENLMGSIYDSEGGLNSQFTPASLIERVKSGEQLTDPEEIAQFQSEIDQLNASGVDLSSLGLEGNEYASGLANDNRLEDLISDKGGYGDISGEDWKAIMSGDLREEMETNIGESDLSAGFDMDTTDFSWDNLDRRLAEKGVSKGKVVNIGETPIYIQHINYQNDDSMFGVDKARKVVITGIDTQTGETVTINGGFD